MDDSYEYLKVECPRKGYHEDPGPEWEEVDDLFERTDFLDIRTFRRPKQSAPEPAMTDSTQALIVRLEKAEEGSRELDEEIASLTGYEWREGYVNHSRKTGWYDPSGFWCEDLPHYTTSLDAALLLVPEGWYVHNISQIGTKRWGVHLTDSIRAVVEEGDWRSSCGNSEALALAIACLRAGRET